MWRIILADWRRFVLILLAGWATALFIVLLTHYGWTRDCCPDDPGKRMMVLRISLIALIYSQTASILWAQYAGNHIYYRQKFIATLPLSQLQLNLTHFLTGFILLAGGTLIWIVIHYVWASFGLSINLWMAVFTLLGTIHFLLLSMRNYFPRLLIPIVLPILIFIPGSERYTGGAIELTTKWQASVVLGVLAIFFAWWVARRPTPNWAPGWGGGRRAVLNPESRCAGN